jgi:hypothetical protein
MEGAGGRRPARRNITDQTIDAVEIGRAGPPRCSRPVPVREGIRAVLFAKAQSR